MKINTKLAVAIIGIFLPSFLIVCAYSNHIFKNILSEREHQEYIRTELLVKSHLDLQGDKLKLLADSINNDSSFLHSTLIAQELGYTDRPYEILQDYTHKNSVDIFLFIPADSKTRISNTQNFISDESVKSVCQSSTPSFIFAEAQMFLVCKDMTYQDKEIGRLLLGYNLYPSYVKMLSTAAGMDVGIYPTEAGQGQKLDTHNANIIRKDGVDYYSYRLSDLLSGASGSLILRRGTTPPNLLPYSVFGRSVYFYIGLLILIMALLYFMSWFIVTRRLKKTHNLIRRLYTERHITADESPTSSDEIAEINQTIDSLISKLDDSENERLKSSNLAAIGQSTAMIAHDVRKPLTGMKALLMSLDDIRDDPEQLKNMMVAVDQSISHTNALLNDILDFSRGVTALKLEEVNSQSILTSALSEVLRKYRDIDVNLIYDMNHTCTMRVDCERVIRVFSNIIDNGMDAMVGQKDKGGAEFRIKSYDTERDGRKFVGIAIADSGTGIPDNVLPKLFDPFFTHGKKGGTGLGLAICQKIISMHGGLINARNNDHKRGAEFIVELPAGTQPVEINESELIRKSSELNSFRYEESQRIEYGDTANTAEFMRINKNKGRPSFLLIVDDEPLFRETVRALSGALGQAKNHIKIVEADSAETALELFKKKEFDYVITDIDLGKHKMSGYEFSQMLLKLYPNTHVLIHSNKRRREMDNNIRMIESNKFMGFLPKPMRASELLQFLACKTFEAAYQQNGS